MTSPNGFDQAFREICREEGPLADRLRRLSALIGATEPEFASAYAALVARVAASVPHRMTPRPGDRLPPFLLPDQEGRLRRIGDFTTQGPLVVSFNRGHWCEYCQLELRAFAEAHAAMARSGARVVSIMPDRIEYTRALAQMLEGRITILSDMDNTYAQELHLVVFLGDALVRLLSRSGLDLERAQGNGMGFVPMPATFVVDRSEIVVYRHVDPDFRNRAETAAVLEAVDFARR